ARVVEAPCESLRFARWPRYGAQKPPIFQDDHGQKARKTRQVARQGEDPQGRRRQGTQDREAASQEDGAEARPCEEARDAPESEIRAAAGKKEARREE